MTTQQKYSPESKASRRLMWLAVAGCVAFISACVSPPAPEKTDSAALGIVMEKQWNENGRKEQVQRVYFIRWNESDDPTKQDEIIESNFHRDGRVYLLNAKPGRYSAVAATDFIGFGINADEHSRQIVRRGVSSARPALVSIALPRFSSGKGKGNQPRLIPTMTFDGDGDSIDEYSAFTTYLSEDLVNKTSVEVRAGEFAVMGRFLVLMKWGIRSGDRAQVHFFRAIGRNMSDPYGMPIFDIDNNLATRAQLVSESRGKETRREILEVAREDFSGTPWESKVTRQVERLR